MTETTSPTGTGGSRGVPTGPHEHGATTTDISIGSGPRAAVKPVLDTPTVGDTPRPRPSEDDITEAMKDVVDPELGINVVDLGLLYGNQVHEDNTVTLDMTLTSAACPLTDVIEDQTRNALAPLVDDVRINWVWMPPWGPDKITDDGREQLRALGFNV
jgi:metal-sulfur cluster biosynthetic enzyme